MVEGLLTAVTRAEQLRRQRLMTRALLRVVPAVAIALLITAVTVRLLRAPVNVFWLALAAAAAGLGVYAWLKSRVPPVTDAAAAQLDADAALNGELRSAHWFASHPVSDPWAAHHLAVAADRVDGIAWPNVYPPVPSARVWGGSAVVAMAAVAVVLTSAWPKALAGGVRPAAPEVTAAGKLTPVSAELQKQIDDLIRGVQTGAIPMDAARQKVSEMRNALADLDPKLQAALAEATKGQQPSDWNAEDPDAKVNALAEKAEKAAANAQLPQDMKWSLQDLAEKLQKASKPSQKQDTGDPARETGAGAKDKDAANGGAKSQEAGVQMTRNAGADSQSNQMMATSSPLDALMKVDPKGNDGGGPKNGAFKPLDLAALKKETIQADADSQGANVLADMRRKSEQSHSTMSFTRVAPLTTYDKSHATAPPPPPDSLRALVKQYFIRK